MSATTTAQTVRAIGWELWFQGVNPKTGKPKDAYYRAVVIGGTVVIHFGKRDTKGQFDVKHQGDFARAKAYVLSKVGEKENDGYRMTQGTTFFQIDAADATAAGTTNSTRANGDPEVSRRIMNAWLAATGRAA